MVIARKNYEYLPIQEEQQKKTPRQQKPKKNYRFAKFMLSMGIIATFSLSLMLLMRFVTITEARHRVHNLNMQLEELENQKERLRIEVERVSKSKWIEGEAKERLNMQYPLPEQVLYIHVHPNEIAMVSSKLHHSSAEVPSPPPNTQHALYRVIDKFVGLFRI